MSYINLLFNNTIKSECVPILLPIKCDMFAYWSLRRKCDIYLAKFKRMLIGYINEKI